MYKQGLKPKTLQLQKHDVRKATEVGTFFLSFPVLTVLITADHTVAQLQQEK